MKIVLMIISLALIQSCSTTKRYKTYGQSIYRLIIDDIKSSQEFKDFKISEGEECSNFLVANYEYHLCEFGIFFKDESINEAYTKRCKNVDLSSLETERNDLNSYSDKGSKCFIVHFSEKIDSRIIVEIISKKNINKIGYGSLNFLFDLGNNQVKKLESITVIHN